MARRLVVSIPRCRCIGCGTVADGEIAYVQPTGGDAGPAAFTVHLNPPSTWAALNANRRPTGYTGPDRTIFICGNCYVQGLEFGGDHKAVASIENTSTLQLLSEEDSHG